MKNNFYASTSEKNYSLLLIYIIHILYLLKVHISKLQNNVLTCFSLKMVSQIPIYLLAVVNKHHVSSTYTPETKDITNNIQSLMRIYVTSHESRIPCLKSKLVNLRLHPQKRITSVSNKVYL